MKYCEESALNEDILTCNESNVTSITTNSFAELRKAVKSGKPLIKVQPSLLTFSLDSEYIEKREEELGDMVYYMNRLVFKSSITNLYAAPNTGKTLTTLAMLISDVKSGLLDGSNCFYVNADDGGISGTVKAKILRKHGINPIILGENGFNEAELENALIGMAESGEANDKLVIIDTLTKFSNVMNKDDARSFYKTLRGFTNAGGTVIVLAHTNKKKDANGRSVFGGVSDTKNDCDTAYLIDAVEMPEDDSHKEVKVKTVIFESDKKRGDTPDQLSIMYKSWEGAQYHELLNSVELTDAEQAKRDKMKAEAKTKRDKKRAAMRDHAIDMYELIVELNSEKTKGEFIKLVQDELGLGRKKVRDIYDEFGGEYWTEKKCKTGAAASKFVMPVKHPREWNREPDT